MKCKTCKSFESDEIEMSIVHLWNTHGIPIEMSIEHYPDLDQQQIQELLQIHKETGKKSIERFKIRTKI